MASMGVWILSLYIISKSSLVPDVSISFEETKYPLPFLSYFYGFFSINSHQALKKDEFYALLSVADLAVITPLRDGMNTTSMEFVIAQEGTYKSPSVLSEFMGISKSMEDALVVNPWSLGVCVLRISTSSAFILKFVLISFIHLRTWLLL